MLGALPQPWQWCPDHPPRPLHTCPLLMLRTRKGRWLREARAPRVLRRGRLHNPPTSPQLKKLGLEKRQPQKSTSTGTSKETKGDQLKKASIWRPIFTLSLGNPVLDDVNLRDPKKGISGLVAKCLEKALCLPKDMEKLRSFRKHEVFLTLKQDLAKVHDYSHLIALHDPICTV